MESVSDDEVEFIFDQNEKNFKKQIHEQYNRLNYQPDQAFKDRRANIRHDKKIYAVGYRLYKSAEPRRPDTPDGSDKEKVIAWKNELRKLQGSEDVEITPDEIHEMLTECKKINPYKYYNETIPKDHELRALKTPEPTEDLRGDEWDLMFHNWRKDLGNFMASGPGNDFVRAQGRKKTKRNERRGKQKEEGKYSKKRRISGPAISDEEVQILDKKQILKEFDRLNPQDPNRNAFKDRKANIERDKKLYAVGYRLYKSDLTRPPTPDGSDQNRHKAWKLDLEELQGSEDIEISPNEVQEMITEFKKTYPFTYYDEMIPIDHELRVIKTPEPTEHVRGDEWDEMYKTWRREVGTFMASGPGNDYARAQDRKKAKGRPKNVDRPREWGSNNGDRPKELRDVLESKRRMAKKRECLEEIAYFKESTAYKTVLNAGIQPRPQTPIINVEKFNKSYEDYKAIADWKSRIDEAYHKKAKFLRERQNRDVTAMKDTLLYMEYAKWYHFGKVKRVRTPDLTDCYTLKDWDLKFEQWKFELKAVVDEYNKERKSSNSTSKEESSAPKQTENSPEAEESSSKTSKIKASQIPIDFKHMLSLDANTDMMTYVQEKSQHYAENLDKTYPDGRGFIGSIVGGCIRYVPCGHYNKDNSCDLPFVHNDEKSEKRIHACALCYFVMGGMINVHRLIQCPLLAT